MVFHTRKNLIISLEVKLSNPIEEQRQIIDMLYRLILVVAPEKFSSAACRFEYDHGFTDGSSSVGSQLTFFNGDEKKYAVLKGDEAFDLVPKLHAEMKSHTGGDWDAFTLFINEDGTVTSKFEYPASSPRYP